MFPHPVEIFSKTGLKIPVRQNYAELFSQFIWKDFPTRIIDFLPAFEPNHHVYPYSAGPFRRNDYSTSEDDIIIGVTYLLNAQATTAHLVFFEVRMNGIDGRPSATIIDPNGQLHDGFTSDLDAFFKDIPYEVAQTNEVNRSEEKEEIKEKLRAIGFKDDTFDLDGCCAVIACYFIVDYACTNQWASRDIGHFVRSTQEWLLSPDEILRGWVSKTGVTIRILLFARYIAYHLYRVVEHIEPAPTKKVTVETSHLASGSIQTTINFGGQRSSFVDDYPYPITSFSSEHMPQRVLF